MTHSPAAQQYLEKQAGALQAGDRLLLPTDSLVAEIRGIEVQYDDFGVPALVIAATSDGGSLRIAAGSTVSVVKPAEIHGLAPQPLPTLASSAREPGGRGPQLDHQNPGIEPVAPVIEPAEIPAAQAGSAVVVPPLPAVAPSLSSPTPEEMALLPEPDGTPEAVVAAAAEEHPGRTAVQLLSERLAKGINTKSGSCLRDLSDLACELYVALKDAQGALAVADLLNVLPFDGNPGRWSSIERSLALSAHIAREAGMEERAEVYEKLLRAPESQETDPFKARMNAKVRQRALNEPNLYDKEIFRSMDSSKRDAEREWRLLRLDSLLFLRAHGGSETIATGELERRIGNELEAVRA